MQPDYLVNDNIHIPDCLEHVSFHGSFVRVAMSFQRMNYTDQSRIPILQDGELGIQSDHPGRRYCYLRKPKKLKRPKLSMPKGMICNLRTPLEKELLRTE